MREEYVGWLDDEWNTVLDQGQPIVRCLDCRHYRSGLNGEGRRFSEPYCGNVGELAFGALFTVPEDWFCADGERKEER